MHRQYTEILYFCQAMKKLTLFTLIALTLTSCAKTDDEMAREMLTRIQTLYEKGSYRATLDSITLLRDRYPAAVEVRKEALVVWQNASLKMAQADVAATDVLLQQTIAQQDTTTNRYQRNMLGLKRDSLQARYDAMCGVVKMIKMRQKKEKKEQKDSEK